LACRPGAAGAVPQTQVHYVRGTYLRIPADGEGAAAGMTACFQEARRLEHVFSRFDATSELSRVNAEAPGTWPASDDMAHLLDRSRALADATGGGFGAAVGPLPALRRRPRPPRPDAIPS